MIEYIRKEDAIQALMGHFLPQTYCGEEVDQAKSLAESIMDGVPTIEASEDCISREYILNGLSEMADDWVINNAVQHGIYEAHDFVKDAPSAERLDQAMTESEE